MIKKKLWTVEISNYYFKNVIHVWNKLYNKKKKKNLLLVMSSGWQKKKVVG